MWNYSFVIPSLFILLLFMGYYFMLPRIPIKTNQTFLKLVAVEALVLIFDMVSTWACMNYQTLPEWLLYLLNDAYFVVFYIRGYMFFLFIIYVLRIGLNAKKSFHYLLQLPVFIVSIITITAPRTGWVFYFDGNGYNSGPLYNILYLIFWGYLAASFLLVFKNKNRLRRKRELNSCIWYNVILLLGSIARMMFPSYLLMDTFCLMALIVIYLSFENPDFYLEERTWIFNSRSFRDYIEEINNKKRFRLLVFVVRNYRDNRELYGVKQMDQGIQLISDFLRKAFMDKKVFYYRSGRFAVLGDTDMDYQSCLDVIKERFTKPWKADEAELFLDLGAAFLEFGKKELTYETVMNNVVNAFEIAAQLENGEAVAIDDKMLECSLMQIEAKKALNHAIETENVLVYLQPIVSVKTGKIEGAEALARMPDKDGKIIPPDLFIPIAEKNGMINQVGDQVFKKVCRFIRDNEVEKIGMEWINVNLSPIQFMRRDLADRLYDYTKEYGISPEFIHLEITEETMIDETLFLKQMQALNSKGFKFVLDDYGKGYSNMTRLKKCPFVNIKLDMSIVWDYCKNPDEIIPSMVETFDKIGFGITAEGIEDKNMMDKMASIGVSYLQGFYFSRAVSMEEFMRKFAE